MWWQEGKLDPSLLASHKILVYVASCEGNRLSPAVQSNKWQSPVYLRLSTNILLQQAEISQCLSSEDQNQSYLVFAKQPLETA